MSKSKVIKIIVALGAIVATYINKDLVMSKSYELYKSLNVYKVFGVSLATILVVGGRMIFLNYISQKMKYISPTQLANTINIIKENDKLKEMSDATKSGKELLELGAKRVECKNALSSIAPNVIAKAMEVMRDEN